MSYQCPLRVSSVTDFHLSLRQVEEFNDKQLTESLMNESCVTCKHMMQVELNDRQGKLIGDASRF